MHCLGLNTETAYNPSYGVQTSSSIWADQWELRILCEAFINRFLPLSHWSKIWITGLNAPVRFKGFNCMRPLQSASSVVCCHLYGCKLLVRKMFPSTLWPSIETNENLLQWVAWNNARGWAITKNIYSLQSNTRPIGDMVIILIYCRCLWIYWQSLGN